MKAWVNRGTTVILRGCLFGVFVALLSLNAHATEIIRFTCHDESGSEYGEWDVTSLFHDLKLAEKHAGRELYEKDGLAVHYQRALHSLIWVKSLYYHQIGDIEGLYRLEEQLRAILRDAEFSEEYGYRLKKSLFEPEGEDVPEKNTERFPGKFYIGAFAERLSMVNLFSADLTGDVKAQAEAVEIADRIAARRRKGAPSMAEQLGIEYNPDAIQGKRPV